jgi:hypothetical protein
MPMVEWTARLIPDPVLRLRFLRAAAPVWQTSPATSGGSSRWRGASVSLVAIGLLLAAAGYGMERWKGKKARTLDSAVVVTDFGANAGLNPLAPPGLALPEAAAAPEIWLVEKSAVFESYSNGLRIDNRFLTVNHSRSYRVFSAVVSGDAVGEARNAPAGIVYHTTESLQAPFEAQQNGKLKKVGEALLDYVKRKKAYNFVIDRFGRVFRLVAEADAAEHAGYSVWSDERWLYVNLNESFLGVAVETRTQAGQEAASLTAAQIRATAMLTEMLRSRYHIAAGNCVTHAQVSVSPTRMLAGYHMDWASSFPFEAIGLPDNYARPLPSIAVFGFDCDASFLKIAGIRLSQGAELGTKQQEKWAAGAGVSVDAYRQAQRKQYRQLLAATRGAIATREGG